MLTFAYVVLVLPYAYRALDAALSAIDVRTLSEAARSLGAGWFTVIVRIIMPNITGGILGAAFIAVALVLGEYVVRLAAALRHPARGDGGLYKQQRSRRHGRGARVDDPRVRAARRPHLPQP